MPKRRLHVVAYDVRCQRRLRRALQAVRAFASGGQKSVHECWLAPAEKRALAAALAEVIDGAEDSIVILALEPRAGVRTLGVARVPRDEAFVYLG